MMTTTRNKRKTLTVVLSLVLVAAVAIGGSLAYLFSKTESKENVFTFADNIKGDLDEPNWDPKEAEDLTPGKEIDKDPQITNTSEKNVTEYAAIKLVFQNGAGETISDENTAKLLGMIDIDWSKKWTIQGSATSAQQIYVYNEPLPRGAVTEPIFSSVTIPDSLTGSQLEWLVGNYGHTDDCYAAGTHDGAKCEITYRHHKNCAIFGLADAEHVAQGGSIGDKTCDCKAVTVHHPDCPALTKTLKGTCGHNTLVSGLGNFTIRVEGAVVQADAFDGLFGTDTATESYAANALVTLFS